MRHKEVESPKGLLALLLPLLLGAAVSRASATEYCYAITSGFDTGVLVTSLLMPVSMFPPGHAALRREGAPCGNYSVGDPLPSNGSWSRDGTNASCATVSAGELWCEIRCPRAPWR